MDLDEGEFYAAAALFTLALHQCQVEVGVDEKGRLLSDNTLPWGCPRSSDTDELLEHPEVLKVIEEQFWGWDSIGPSGLCRQVFKHLEIPETKWVGLLKLPGFIGEFCSLEGVELLVQLVQFYSMILDPDLTVKDEKARQRAHSRLNPAGGETMDMNLIPSDVDSTSGGSPRKDDGDGSDNGVNVSSSLQEGVELASVDVSDPEKKVGAHTELHDSAMNLDLESENKECEKQIRNDKSLDASNPADSANLPHEGTSLAAIDPETEPDEGVAAVDPAMSCSSNSEIHIPAAKSCAALHVLLAACLMDVPTRSKKGTSSKSGDHEVLGDFEAKVQWYDARCRVALLRVVYWLKVPLSTFSAFEASIASSIQDHRQKGTLKTSGSSFSRWAKVGAVALGGGAAIALTGGLAAPAIAAGLGSAITMVGGGAAAASAVTGFAASTAGTATITSAFGAYGASQTGSLMARRTANIKEFGFWDISEEWEDPEDDEATAEGSASPPKSKFKALFKAKTYSKMFKAKPNASDNEQVKDHADSSAANDRPEAPGADAHVNVPEGSEDPGASCETSNPQSSSNLDGDGKNQDTAVTGGTSSTEENSQNAGGGWLKNWMKAKEHRPLLPLPVNPKSPEWNLGLTICVTGWLKEYEDFLRPWTCIPGASTDRFALVWEAKELKEVGEGLMSMIESLVTTEAAKWFVKKYFYTGLIHAVAIPALILTISSITIDNKWAIVQQRASKGGKLLAQCFAEGFHGNRPVTLVSFSLGARLVFHCLLELSRMGKAGVVENVILLGAPVGLNYKRWSMARSVVAGRFVNGYSSKDWVLGVTYRASKGFIQKAAGCCPVEVDGVENIDLSDVIAHHADYLTKMKEVCTILDLCKD